MKLTEGNSAKVRLASPKKIGSLLLIVLYSMSGSAAELEETLQGYWDSDNFGYSFGSSVAIDGNRIIVGAPYTGWEEGAAYVYEQATDGSWSRILGRSGSLISAGYFGTSVAIDSDLAVMGSPFADEVHVYEKQSSTTWSETNLTASNSTNKDLFGFSVSADPNMVVIGAPSNDELGSDSGAVYIFEKNAANVWVETILLASDGLAGDRFGWSVQVHQNKLIVGAKDNDNSGTDAGAVYIFERNNQGGWNETKLLATDGLASDRFGYSVSIYGNRAIVGTNNTGASQGAVYLFDRVTEGVWTETKFSADDAGASYGRSVSVFDNRFIVGAYQGDDSVNSRGFAYLYESDATGVWSEEKLDLYTSPAHAYFGDAVAIGSNYLVVGAPGENPGNAHIYNFNAPPAVVYCMGKIVNVNLNLGQTPTHAADVILGTPGDDTIYALGGDDTICAGGGNDIVHGGYDNDQIDGGANSDILIGGNGNDQLIGGSGGDRIYGGYGNDHVIGGDGSDRMTGDDGADMLFGGNGNDVIFGGKGGDYIHGDAGHDRLFGQGDSDEVHGGDGDDKLYGGRYNDRLFGDDGNDRIWGETGHDRIIGGAGDDYLNGGDHNDVIFGGAGNDTLRGGDDRDSVYGQGGNDDVRAQAGNDLVTDGGSGADSCQVAPGIDTAPVNCE